MKLEFATPEYSFLDSYTLLAVNILSLPILLFVLIKHLNKELKSWIEKKKKKSMEMIWS